MSTRIHPCAMFAAILLCGALRAADETPAAPHEIRGLHCMAPSKGGVPACEKFIREVLKDQGVTHLILEIDYGYNFHSCPELANPGALDEKDIKKLLAACRDAKITLVPQINCLGHQSWSSHTAALLKAHPEFDETPAVPADNKGIYCRSWCPLHPDVHKTVFALIDELADACEATDFHVGMDEVFLIADAKCPRCGGKDPAELFAGEVTLLHDHLSEKKRKMWMWADRFIDGKATGIGKWEASTNGTAAAVDKVPKDIVLCDWHYEKAHDTAAFFVQKGFTSVVTCPWKKVPIALEQVKKMRVLEADPANKDKTLGIVQTTWIGLSDFIKGYEARGGSDSAKGSSECFKQVFEAMKQK